MRDEGFAVYLLFFNIFAHVMFQHGKRKPRLAPIQPVAWRV